MEKLASLRCCRCLRTGGLGLPIQTIALILEEIAKVDYCDRNGGDGEAGVNHVIA